MGLANSLAWQKLLENEMGGGGLSQRWGGVAERIKKGTWWWLLGATSSEGWEPVPPTPPLPRQGKPEGR